MTLKYSELKSFLEDRGFRLFKATKGVVNTYSFYKFNTIKTNTEITYIIEHDSYDNVIDTFKQNEFETKQEYLESINYDISRYAK